MDLATLLALEEKYRSLAALRLRREELIALGRTGLSDAEGQLRRAAFRRLAQDFPGCLRELDVRPAQELARRADAVADEIALCRSGQPPRRAWVAVVADFHDVLRRLLAWKLWLAHRVDRRAAVSDGLVREFQAVHGHGDRALVERILRPPHGRVLTLVWEELSARHGQPRVALEAAVFGPDGADVDPDRS